jgi:hypothetical protein
MNCHGNHIFFVKVKELLSVLSFVKDHTESRSCEGDLVLVDVLQVAAGIKASETVCILQLELSIRLLINLRFWILVLRRDAVSDLT